MLRKYGLVICFWVPALSAPASAGEPLTAKALVEQCDFKGALAVLESMPPELRGTPAATLLHCRILVQLGQGHRAVELLSELLAQNQGEVRRDAHLTRALAFSVSGQLKEAERDLQAARKLGADPDIVDLNLAVLKIQAGKLKEADAALVALLRADPRLTGALYNLAVVRAAQGRIAESASLVRQAWALGLRNPDQLRGESGLAPVRESAGLIDDLVESSEHRCTTY